MRLCRVKWSSGKLVYQLAPRKHLVRLLNSAQILSMSKSLIFTGKLASISFLRGKAISVANVCCASTRSEPSLQAISSINGGRRWHRTGRRQCCQEGYHDGFACSKEKFGKAPESAAKLGCAILIPNFSHRVIRNLKLLQVTRIHKYR